MSCFFRQTFIHYIWYEERKMEIHLFCSIFLAVPFLDLLPPVGDLPLGGEYFEVEEHNQEQRNEKRAWTSNTIHC